MESEREGPLFCRNRSASEGVDKIKGIPKNAVQSFEGVLRSQHRVYDGNGEVARTQDVWGAEGISGRVKFLPLAWAGMPKTSFRKNSDSPQLL
ncbi:hypothetical protein BMR04_11820 [Methylococcaceae bacterium HT3]|nr:hypothetical protein BMR04_11820 [Methylococcaceae bacterium HT3]